MRILWVCFSSFKLVYLIYFYKTVRLLFGRLLLFIKNHCGFKKQVHASMGLDILQQKGEKAIYHVLGHCNWNCMTEISAPRGCNNESVIYSLIQQPLITLPRVIKHTFMAEASTNQMKRIEIGWSKGWHYNRRE